MVMHLLKKKYYPIKMVSIDYMMEMMEDLLKTQLLVLKVIIVGLIISIWIGLKELILKEKK